MYRICSEGSHFQFPEVRIGIIPGALGTQFLPRLASFETSLSMCVGCNRLTSKQALEAGIIDSIGVMELVTFIGNAFKVTVPPEDILPDNFDSVQKLADYVRRKQG